MKLMVKPYMYSLAMFVFVPQADYALCRGNDQIFLLSRYRRTAVKASEACGKLLMVEG